MMPSLIVLLINFNNIDYVHSQLVLSRLWITQLNGTVEAAVTT